MFGIGYLLDTVSNPTSADRRPSWSETRLLMLLLVGSAAVAAVAGLASHARRPLAGTGAGLLGIALLAGGGYLVAVSTPRGSALPRTGFCIALAGALGAMWTWSRRRPAGWMVTVLCIPLAIDGGLGVALATPRLILAISSPPSCGVADPFGNTVAAGGVGVAGDPAVRAAINCFRSAFANCTPRELTVTYTVEDPPEATAQLSVAGGMGICEIQVWYWDTPASFLPAAGQCTGLTTPDSNGGQRLTGCRSGTPNVSIPAMSLSGAAS